MKTLTLLLVVSGCGGASPAAQAARDMAASDLLQATDGDLPAATDMARSGDLAQVIQSHDMTTTQATDMTTTAKVPPMGACTQNSDCDGWPPSSAGSSPSALCLKSGTSQAICGVVNYVPDHGTTCINATLPTWYQGNPITSNLVCPPPNVEPTDITTLAGTSLTFVDPTSLSWAFVVQPN